MKSFWAWLLMVLGSSHGARILGIFPTASISHQVAFQAVMKALARRGHQVTVISPNPLKVSQPNYTDIDLSFTYEQWASFKDEFQKNLGKSSPYQVMTDCKKTFIDTCHVQLSSEEIQTFLKSKQTFDLVFLESIVSSCMYGIIHNVGSPPVIGILSLGGTSPNYYDMGSPYNPAVDPDIFWPYNDHMTFSERLNNFIFWLWYNGYYMPSVRWEMEKISREYFGAGIPSVWESEKNTSLLMLSNSWTLSYPRPVVPAIISLGALHIDTQRKPLPTDIQVFLDNATDGFIYFSLGSNVRSDKVPEHRRREFLDAFAELPQRVLWKWEADSLPGQPDNVMVNKWLPQQDVLAHPNCRLFMTQGGLQSFQEATHHAVPLLGIPFFGDQDYNVKKMITAGVGLKLDAATATKQVILDTIKSVINDPRYAENMRRLSAISRDEPQPPVERAVWWTEYVLRHKGARHLRSAALDLSWPQYLLLDVIGFLVAVTLISITVLVMTLKRIWCAFAPLSSSKLKQQ